MVPNANPNVTESTLGWTALHASTVTDAVECARLLLKCGADPSVPSVICVSSAFVVVFAVVVTVVFAVCVVHVPRC
jgi:hypothetical protein